jgi:sugar lactone lactonase YvrE
VGASGNVYVADTGNDRIQKFDNNGTFLTGWGSSGTGNGLFSGPSGVTVDGSGHVFVADTNNNRIQKFDGSGTFLTAWGTTGAGNGQFQFPFGAATDGSGNVYIAEYGNNRIQRFDASGTLRQGEAPPQHQHSRASWAAGASSCFMNSNDDQSAGARHEDSRPGPSLRFHLRQCEPDSAHQPSHVISSREFQLRCRPRERRRSWNRSHR